MSYLSIYICMDVTVYLFCYLHKYYATNVLFKHLYVHVFDFLLIYFFCYSLNII